MSAGATPEALLDKAIELAKGAYAPYSNFQVGAVAVADDGTEYTGVNVENAAYGSTMCAEMTAIGAAVSARVRKIDTIAVGTTAGSGHYPCGNCRQLMQEFEVDKIVVQAPGGGARVHTLDELLPHYFGPEDLKG